MRSIPALGWLSHYDRDWLRADVIAAITLWALVVPQAIAYAQIAGLPPESGLFACFAGLLAYGLLGSSRQLVVNPTSSTAAISAALIAPLVISDPSRYASLSATLAIMVGIALLLLAFLKMGFVSRFIAAGVQVGFMIGLGLTIIAGQLPKLFGISSEQGDFFPEVRHLISNLDDTNGWTFILGFGSLAALLYMKRAVPAAPAALICVVSGIAIVGLLGLDNHGVAVIGSIDSAVPELALPSIQSGDLRTLLPGALAIAIIGYAETATVAQSLADKHRYDVRPNQELTAIGAANILSGFFQGFIVGGGASQSAANDRAGARTQLVSLIVAVLAVVTSIALLPLFRNLPLAVLGAIVINAVLSFINIPALRRLADLRTDGFIVALIAMAGVLLLGVLAGLLVAVGLTILALLERGARPSASLLGRLRGNDAFVDLEREPDAIPPPGFLLYRLNAPMLFLNAKQLRDDLRSRLEEAPAPVHTVVLDLAFSADLDIESLDVLEAVLRDLEEQGIDLWLVNVHAAVRAMLRRGGLTEKLGEDRIFRTVEDATPRLNAATRQDERHAA